MLSEGKILGGSYQCIRELGQGGQSSVWLVRNIHTEQLYAAKQTGICQEESEKPDKSGARIRRQRKQEATILRQLKHPAIPLYIEEIEFEEASYLIMEYLTGENLRSKLEREGPQDESAVVDWGLQLSDIFLYLHAKQIIYRDVKPGNLILTEDGRIHLIDFGCARRYDAEKNEDTIYLGTRGYAAPELYGSDGQSDAGTDIYGFGMTLFHLLSGISPTELKDGEFPQTEKISPKLMELIRHCTMPERKERCQDFGIVRHSLLYYRKEQKSIRSRHFGKSRVLSCLFAGLLLLAGFLCIWQGGMAGRRADRPEHREDRALLAEDRYVGLLNESRRLGLGEETATLPAHPRLLQTFLADLVSHAEELNTGRNMEEMQGILQTLSECLEEAAESGDYPEYSKELVQSLRLELLHAEAVLNYYRQQKQREGDLYSSIDRIRRHTLAAGFYASVSLAEKAEEESEAADSTGGRDFAGDEGYEGEQ